MDELSENIVNIWSRITNELCEKLANFLIKKLIYVWGIKVKELIKNRLIL